MYYRDYKNAPDKTKPSNGEIGLAISYDGGASFSLYNSGIPVVTHGSGCVWDSYQAIAPSVVRVDATHWYMVYEGSGCFNLGSVGWASSSDGQTWTKNGILLQGNAVWEVGPWSTGNIGTPFIGYFNQKFYIFYHGYDGVRSQIGFASGPNLSSLTKFGSPVIHNPDVDHWDWYVNSRASIIQEGSYYYMTFEGSTNPDPACTRGNWGWGIARTTATNLDLGIWDKYAFNPIRQTYNGGCSNDLPYIFRFNNEIYVYQREQGQRNHVLTGLPGSSVAGSDSSVKDPYLYVWRANVQCQAYHRVGYLDGVAWAAATGNGQGHMCYGPYVQLPNGHYVVSFRDKEDVVQCAYCVNVINNEIYDSSTSTSVLRIDINRPDLMVPDTYNSLNYQFCGSGAHQYEFRTWYYNTALIHQDAVFVRWLDTGPECVPSSGFQGGSVAQGTGILTPNGNVPVQNLNAGDTVISIDPFTQQMYHSTITSINVVEVGNMLIFHTATGQPLRVDINPRLRFNAIHNGQFGLWSTVILVPGDSLYQSGYGWTTITGIDRIYGGRHTYYDLHLDPQHDFIANGYADCPCKL
jgi:hypothetical protein